VVSVLNWRKSNLLNGHCSDPTSYQTVFVFSKMNKNM
jgi:hypothetical protein